MDKKFGNLFLSAGAMKAGTTWLSMVLKRHPDLYFTIEKELHYFFNREFGSNLLSSYQRHEKVRIKYVPLLMGDPSGVRLERSRSKNYLKRRFGHFLPRLPINVSKLSDTDKTWVKQYLSEPVDDTWFRRLYPKMENGQFACEFSNLSAFLSSDSWRELEAQTNTLKVLFTLRDPIRRLWSHTKFQLEMTGRLDRLDS